MIVTFFSHWSEQELQQDNPERGDIPGEELHPGITSVLLVNVYKDGQTVQRFKSLSSAGSCTHQEQTIARWESSQHREKPPSHEREKNLTSDENSLIKLRKTKSNTASVKRFREKHEI